MPEQASRDEAPARGGTVKLKTVDRRQTIMAFIDVEELIPTDHKARAIWE